MGAGLHRRRSARAGGGARRRRDVTAPHGEGRGSDEEGRNTSLKGTPPSPPPGLAEPLLKGPRHCVESTVRQRVCGPHRSHLQGRDRGSPSPYGEGVSVPPFLICRALMGVPHLSRGLWGPHFPGMQGTGGVLLPQGSGGSWGPPSPYTRCCWGGHPVGRGSCGGPPSPCTRQ